MDYRIASEEIPREKDEIKISSSLIISPHCAIYDQSSRPWDENASSNSTQLGETLSGVEFAVQSIL